MTRNKARKSAARAAAVTNGTSYTAGLRTVSATADRIPAAARAAFDRLATPGGRGEMRKVSAREIGTAAAHLTLPDLDQPTLVTLQRITASAEVALGRAAARTNAVDRMLDVVGGDLLLPVGQAEALLDLCALALTGELPPQAGLFDGFGAHPNGFDSNDVGALLAAAEELTFARLALPRLPRRIAERNALALPFHAAAAAAGAPRGKEVTQLGDPSDRGWPVERDMLARLAAGGADPDAFAALLADDWHFGAAATVVGVLRPPADILAETFATALRTVAAAGTGDPEGRDATEVAYSALVAAEVGVGDVSAAPEIAEQEHLVGPLHAAFHRAGNTRDRQTAAEVVRQRSAVLLRS